MLSATFGSAKINEEKSAIYGAGSGLTLAQSTTELPVIPRATKTTEADGLFMDIVVKSNEIEAENPTAAVTDLLKDGDERRRHLMKAVSRLVWLVVAGLLVVPGPGPVYAVTSPVSTAGRFSHSPPPAARLHRWPERQAQRRTVWK
ncbi:MAG TPA: hypothetical protein PKE45_00195 [Caldilineaceae bacterium]|nr:hypothetical protein [Caldilineaceae bacterium]